MKKKMPEEERRNVAFHEAGHVAMIFWRRESLHDRRIVLRNERYGGSVVSPLYDSNESDLMVLLGGPIAELLSTGVVPKVPVRNPTEYQDANSDSTRIRNLVRRVRNGRDDKRYELEVQEHCRQILEEPCMWQAITRIAQRLIIEGEVSGEDCEGIFQRLSVKDKYA